MDAIFTEPSRWLIYERILDLLKPRELIRVTLINRNTLNLVTSSSKLQLKFRRLKHNLPIPATDQGTAGARLKRLISHQNNLSLCRPQRLDSVNLTYPPSIALEDNHLLAVDGIKSTTPETHWVLENECLDIGFEVWRLPAPGSLPKSGGAVPGGTGTEEESDQLKRIRCVWGKPLFAVAVKASENLLAIVSPIPESELVEGSPTVGRISFLCLYPPDQKAGQDWYPVRHPEARRPYIDVAAGHMPTSQTESIFPMMPGDDTEMSLQGGNEQNGSRCGTVIRSRSLSPGPNHPQPMQVEGSDHGDAAFWANEGSVGHDEDELVEAGEDNGDGDWEDASEESEEEEEEDLSRFDGKLVLLSINIGEDGMAWSDVFVAGWSQRKVIWWDWKTGESLGMSGKGKEFGILEYGLLVELRIEHLNQKSAPGLESDQPALIIHKTSSPLAPTRTYTTAEVAAASAPTAFCLSDMQLIHREMTFNILRAEGPREAFTYSESTVEIRHSAIKGMKSREAHGGGRLLVGMEVQTHSRTADTTKAYIWGSVALDHILTEYRRRIASSGSSAKTETSLHRQGGKGPQVVAWSDWGSPFDFVVSRVEDQWAFSSHDRMIVIGLIEEDFTETLLTDKLIFIEIITYSGHSAIEGSDYTYTTDLPDHYRPLGGGAVMHPPDTWKDLKPPFPEIDYNGHFHPLLTKRNKPVAGQMPEIIFRRVDIPEKEEVEEGSEQALFLDFCRPHEALPAGLSVDASTAGTGKTSSPPSLIKSRARAAYGLRPNQTINEIEFDGERLIISSTDSETDQTRISILTF